MKKIYFAIALMLLTSITLFSQSSQSLQGTVTDENGEPLMFATVALKKGGQLINGAQTDFDGKYSLNNINAGEYDVEVSYVGYSTKTVSGVVIFADKSLTLNIEMSQGIELEEVVITYTVPLVEQDNTTQGTVVTSKEIDKLASKSINGIITQSAGVSSADDGSAISIRGSRSNATDYYIDGNRVNGSKFRKKKDKSQPLQSPEPNSESYANIKENAFKTVKREPLSTFSIDVDKASYSNVRRFIENGQKPPKDAVRIEEMINYFDYNYAAPTDEHPIIVHTELGDCPWNKNHQLVKVGLKAKEIPKDDLPYSNIVFLLDVSGSMSDDLELVKSAMSVLVEGFREGDKISIVVYAGAAGLVLSPTDGSDKQTILKALNKLKSGGSTAGGQGIELAYKVAKEQFIEDGNNRIILATDGDFNVGMSSNTAMEDLIIEKRKSGIYLTCLGFGMGNYQDSKMELLADKGNGNYAYIDSKEEAIKVFKTEFSGTMFTIAKDVKFQLEFNPAVVAGYRLIGYENRLLEEADFDNDAKDAGEVGVGHTVTALYEIIPVDTKSEFLPKEQILKYQKNGTGRNKKTSELLTVKLRYKPTDATKSIKLEYPVKYEISNNNNNDFDFSASVALFGMLLRESEYIKDGDFDMVLKLAKKGKGDDEKGYRKDFIKMVKKADGQDLGGEEAVED
jgi:Ca-activated chloride channel family protein